MKRIKIEGIIQNASYDRGFNVEIQLKIQEEIYKICIPSVGSVSKLQVNLDINQKLRLEGILDEEQKVIKDPKDIWVNIF